jgi:hypothetical protein
LKDLAMSFKYNDSKTIASFQKTASSLTERTEEETKARLVSFVTKVNNIATKEDISQRLYLRGLKIYLKYPQGIKKGESYVFSTIPSFVKKICWFSNGIKVVINENQCANKNCGQEKINSVWRNRGTIPS